MVYRGSKMAAGEKYLYHPGQLDPRTISREDLSAWLATAGQDLVRSIVRGLNMGGTYGEEVCLRSGVDKNKPAADLDPVRLSGSFGPARGLSAETLDPHIVLDAGEPVDVSPGLSRSTRAWRKSAFPLSARPLMPSS